MRNILVATDGSTAATAAVQLATDLAADRGAELVIVHVVPAVDFISTDALDNFVAARAHELTDYDHVLLENAEDVATQRGVPSTTVLRAGSTVDEIVACAEAHDADLTIVGTRGHGTIASALLGSVSLGVLRASTRPVVIVHAA